MTTTIKITELTNIGANLASSTVIPVVNMAGTPTTEKTVLGNIANVVLAGAGGNYVAAAKATTATTANTVLTNAQPNITSVGTLTSLSVTGNITSGNANLGNLTTSNYFRGIFDVNSSNQSNITNVGNLTRLTVSNATGVVNFSNTANVTLGNVANLHITGGTNGDVLQTDGEGNLSWTAQSGGGGANTGNVTFDDINIIGTGNLNLQPDSANASAYLNIFLTGGPDIHIAGNGQTVILGTDEQANVAVNVDGNVSIQAGNVSGTQTWNFGTDGNLTLPRGGVVYETNIPDGGLNGNTIALKPSGGTNADQQLLIYPTTNDANHLHLTSGNLYSTELFLGDDNLYVKLANTGNIVINSNDDAGNTAQWTLDTTGNLYLPGNLVIAGNANVFGANRALIQPANDLPLIALSSGANGAISSVWVEDIGNVGTSNIAAVYANPTSGSGIVRIVVGQNGVGSGPNLWDFNANGTLTFPGTPRIDTSTNNFEVQAAEAINFEANTVVNIYTDTGNNAFQWQFGDDGNLTLPATTGVIANVSITLEANDTGNSTGLSLIGDAHANLYAHGNVTIVSDSGNTTATWNFDETGNLTVPGDLIGPASANFTIYSNAGQHNFTFADDGTFYAPDDAVLGGNTIYIGPGANTLTGLAQAVMIASSNHSAYIQAVINNVSDNGSADWVAQGRLGDDNGGWADFGFTSGGFNDANYTITGPGDGYLFVESYAPGQLITGPKGGNLILATGEQGTVRDIIFGTGGFLTGNIFGRMSDANNSFELSRAGATITFPDSTEQNTAWTGSLTTIANGNSNVSIPTANGNIVITSSGTNGWNFDTTGNLTIPGSSGGFIKTIANASIGIAAIDNGTNNPAQLLSMTNAGAATSIVSAYSTNATIQTNATGTLNTWSFDNAGNLTLPTGGQIIVSGGLVSSGASPAPTINGFSITNSVGISGNGNIAGNNISATGDVTANTVNITTGNITTINSGLLQNGNSNITLTSNGNVSIQSAGSNVELVVTSTGVNVAGTLNVTGNVTANNLNVTGNVTANNANINNMNRLFVSQILDSGNFTATIRQTFTNTLGVQDYGPTLQLNRDGGLSSSPSLQYKAGAIQFSDNGLIKSEFIYNGTAQYGNLRFYVSNGFASGSALQEILTLGYEAGNQKVVTISGNANVGNISATGNISANNFTGNGGTLSNVATKVEGSWTLASGTNTVSINVPLNGTYALWVNGNIPNGIVTYTATAVVTNTNVPVLGEQYAWYYAVGNALVFTSIPDQFTGTVGSISNVNTYLGNTANVFTFGITNNSGNTAVVNYGYTKL